MGGGFAVSGRFCRHGRSPALPTMMPCRRRTPATEQRGLDRPSPALRSLQPRRDRSSSKAATKRCACCAASAGRARPLLQGCQASSRCNGVALHQHATASARIAQRRRRRCRRARTRATRRAPRHDLRPPQVSPDSRAAPQRWTAARVSASSKADRNKNCIAWLAQHACQSRPLCLHPKSSSASSGRAAAASGTLIRRSGSASMRQSRPSQPAGHRRSTAGRSTTRDPTRNAAAPPTGSFCSR